MLSEMRPENKCCNVDGPSIVTSLAPASSSTVYLREDGVHCSAVYTLTVQCLH